MSCGLSASHQSSGRPRPATGIVPKLCLRSTTICHATVWLRVENGFRLAAADPEVLPALPPANRPHEVQFNRLRSSDGTSSAGTKGSQQRQPGVALIRGAQYNCLRRASRPLVIRSRTAQEDLIVPTILTDHCPSPRTSICLAILRLSRTQSRTALSCQSRRMSCTSRSSCGPTREPAAPAGRAAVCPVQLSRGILGKAQA